MGFGLPLFKKTVSFFSSPEESDNKDIGGHPPTYSDYVRSWENTCKLKVLRRNESKNYLSGELLRSTEEGGKTSSQYIIKYLSSLLTLKKYRKCTNAPLLFS